MAGHTDNAVEVNAPLKHVWDRMMDIEGWPSLFSEYAQAEVLERDGERIVFRLATHPDPEYDGKVWSWTSERVADPSTHSSKSRRIETGPFEYMNIEWYFEEIEGGTRMRWVQDFSMKPSAPNNDEQAEEYLNKNTKVQMGVIKEKLEAEAAGGGSGASSAA
jgi:aromatase